MNLARLLVSTGGSAACAVALALVCTPQSEAAVSEAQVKAAYLYKLASFVRWPPSAFADADAPLRICVTGRSDVHGVVETMTRGQAASGRRLVAQLVDPTRADVAVSCQILFIGQGSATARALLAQVGERPILTVTDRSAGIRGGIIEFVRASGNIRFAIHNRAAEQRQLSLSSKLLAVAASVEP